MYTYKKYSLNSFLDYYCTSPNIVIINKMILSIITGLVIAILLIAGLYPFQFKPLNAVSRVLNNNGIMIHDKCLIYENTHNALPGIVSFLEDASPLSIECIVKPYPTIGNKFAYILCIYDDFEPELLTVAKWKSYLLLRRRIPLQNGTYNYHEVETREVLISDKIHHVMISMDSKGASVFIDGLELKTFPGFCIRVGNEKTSGYRIILGNEPRLNTPWIGEMFGLALYNSSFNSMDAMRHYLAWTQHDYKTLSKERGIEALYPMDEVDGLFIQNIASKKGNLIIPGHIYTLKKSILSLPWMHFWENPVFYIDIILNILGFIPLGFFLLALLISYYGKTGRLYDMVTVLIGSSISFTIELIQVWMPARTSSLTDLLCNILGTILGVMLFHKVYSIYLAKMKKPDESGLSSM